MVIDFHVHCFPDEIAAKAISVLEQNAGFPAKLNGTVSDLKSSMKKSGIDHSVVLSIATNPSQTEKINNWSAEIQDNDISAFGSIHPEYTEWKRELRRIKQLGLKGIKLHPDYQKFYVDDRKMYPMYELALELGLIIVFHAGVDIGLPAPYHCTPERLLKVLRDIPGGKFVAAHMGGYYYWDDVEKLLVGKDIYLDTSYLIGRIKDEQFQRIIGNHDYRRILFATDSPWVDQSAYIEKFKSLIPQNDLQKAILCENGNTLLQFKIDD
jgi:predicted TIM-barrel fold metal-dependent hydrolase